MLEYRKKFCLFNWQEVICFLLGFFYHSICTFPDLIINICLHWNATDREKPQGALRVVQVSGEPHKGGCFSLNMH